LKSIYLFDAWEPRFYAVARYILDYRVDLVFFSSRQATEHFSRTLPEVESHWVPEAIRSEDYYWHTQALKDIDVLQFGRKYDWYHEQIIDYCKHKKLKYLFEETQGNTIFPTRREFLNGLARARISICVPCNITHPARSGSVSTMTMRYLQSMAAKCLIVGVLPDDMKDLFDYCPLVEIDFKDPVEQLDKILNNFDSYLALVERNYLEVISKHHWKNRMEEIERVLARRPPTTATNRKLA
jgi:hypothetical protein